MSMFVAAIMIVVLSVILMLILKEVLFLFEITKDRD